MTAKTLSSKSFEEAYEQHSLWISSQGQKGNRLEIRNVKLSQACNIKNKDLSDAKVLNVDFSEHNLEGVKFNRTDLTQCDLSRVSCLDIESLSESVLLSTKLPEGFSFEPLIKTAEDIASKQKGFTRLYVLVCLAFLFICLTVSDEGILLRKFQLPNPFFEFSSNISYLTFILWGLLIVQVLDLFLLPLTKDATTAYKKLPRVFPDGLKLLSIVPYWAYRWSMSEKDRLSKKTKNRMELDYKNSISYYFAFVFGLRVICYVVALSALGYTGILADYASYLPEPEHHISSINFLDSTKYFNAYSALPLFFLVMVPNLLKTQGFYIDGLGQIFFILYAAAIVSGNLVFAGAFASSVIISYLIYKHNDESIRMSFKAALIIMIVFLACFFRYGSLNIDGQSLSDKSLLEKRSDQVLGEVKGANLEKLTLESLSAKGVFAPYTNFSHALLKGANFKEAELSYSNFEGAVISGVNFTGANLVGAKGLNSKNICETKGYDTATLDFTPECNTDTPHVPIAQ